MLTTSVTNIKNNAAFDLAALEQTIDEIKLSSFANLYQFQKDLAGIKRFDLTMNQLVQVTNITGKRSLYTKKFVGYVKTDFIHKSKRLLYKRSAFFGKELSIFDVANNSKLFTYNYMVFVDGKFVDSINILPKDDRTALIFDVQDQINPVGIPWSHFTSLRDANAKITVFFIPNAIYGVYNTTRADLDKYKNQLALSDLNLAGNLATDANYITFVKDKKLLFNSVVTDTTNSANMLRFVANGGLPNTGKQIHLNVFGFRNLHNQLIIPSTDKFFRIANLKMPVPIENMMVFRNNVDGTKTFAHDITLKQYYPNVYEVLNNTTNTELTIYVFYSKDNGESILKYTNDLAVYEKFMGTGLSKYIDGSIPTLVRDYVAQSMAYSIEDFNSSAQYPDHLSYKLNKLSAWIDADPSVFQRYLLKELVSQSAYYIDVSTINLASKLRTNNRTEISNTLSQEDFGENRYVFIIKNEPGDDVESFRFYIDGNAYIPDKRWRQDEYEVFYIQQSLIKPNTVIEIERFKQFRYSTTVSFASVSENEQLTVTKLKDLSRNDIFLVDATNQNIIDKSKYTVSYFNEKGVKTDLGTDSFKVIPNGTFVVNMKDVTLLNRDIQIKIQRDTYYQEHNITEAMSAGETFIFKKAVNPDRRHYRIFRNGRLLNPSLYEVEPSATYNGNNFVTPLVYKELNDKFIIDYTPNKYKIVYEQGLIPANGLLDLRGRIIRPFDLKWYDVYINGRRLTIKNIEVISPYIVFIKNISSLKNLLIIERDKDIDFFKHAVGARTLTDKLWDTDVPFKTAVLAGRTDIVDIEPDVISEIITEASLELLRFFNLYISILDFINPDTMQLTDEQKAEYPALFQGNVFPLDPDKDYNPRSYVMKIFNN